MGTSVNVPITDGKLNLGTWQGIWLNEHRNNAGIVNIRFYTFYTQNIQ